MELLSPKTLTKRKKRGETEQTLRIQKLHELETELTRKTNDAKELHAKTVESIKRNEDEILHASKARKKELLDEIASLEEHRAELLKPIKETREKTEVVLRDAEKQKQKNVIDGLALAEGLRQLENRAHDLDAREQKLNDYEKLVRELKFESEQAENKATQARAALTEQKIEHDAHMKRQRASLDARKADLDAQETALNSSRSAIKAEWDKINIEKNALQDGYKTLGEARERILGRKT